MNSMIRVDELEKMVENESVRSARMARQGEVDMARYHHNRMCVLIEAIALLGGENRDEICKKTIELLTKYS